MITGNPIIEKVNSLYENDVDAIRSAILWSNRTNSSEISYIEIRAVITDKEFYIYRGNVPDSGDFINFTGIGTLGNPSDNGIGIGSIETYRTYVLDYSINHNGILTLHQEINSTIIQLDKTVPTQPQNVRNTTNNTGITITWNSNTYNDTPGREIICYAINIDAKKPEEDKTFYVQDVHYNRINRINNQINQTIQTVPDKTNEIQYSVIFTSDNIQKIFPNGIKNINILSINEHGIFSPSVWMYNPRILSQDKRSVPTISTTATSFKFVAFADTKVPTYGIDILEAESNNIITLNPAFTLYPGDLVDSPPSGTQAEFDLWKNCINGDRTGVTSNNLFNKTFVTRGNHDADITYSWTGNFNFQGIATNVGAINYTEYVNDMTYSFDYGNCHFVGIDMPSGDMSSDLSMSVLNWLDIDLTNAENPSNNRGIKYTFFFWHAPFYCVDGHCSANYEKIPPFNLITIINNHPSVIGGFFGHEHLVAYTHVTNSIPGGPSALIRPFENIITGGAGANLMSLISGRQVDYWIDQDAGGSPTYGYVLMNINGDNVNASFYRSNGVLKRTINLISICNPINPNLTVS